jgi:methionyl-tRNA formyltransferase
LALRLVFMGTPDFAVPTFRKIADSGHKIVAVLTRAPKPAGRRGLTLEPSQIAREAERLDLPVFTPKTLKDTDVIERIRTYRADAAVVVAYGLILPKAILDAFRLGCFNLHASLLPRWRGAAPIQRAIMAGDEVTGVTVMKMEEGLDTGPIVSEQPVSINPNETAGELRNRLSQFGADLMMNTLAELEKFPMLPRPQSTVGVTRADKIEKSETRIDWKKPYKTVHDHCRGLSPDPGAWFELPGTGRVKVLRTAIGHGNGPPGVVLDEELTIACGHGALRILEVQPESRKRMSADEFLRGRPPMRGGALD